MSFPVLFGLYAGLLLGLGGHDLGLAGVLGDIGMRGWLIVGLSSGLGVGLAVGVVSGLSGKEVDDRDSRMPNEGIRRSVWNSVIAGVAIALVGGAPVGLGLGLAGGLGPGLAGGMGIALIGGTFAGLLSGGSAAMQHIVLRWGLRRSGMVPPHLVRFLNYCAQHVLVQNVGGGYRFVHILLRDYFADLNAQGPGIAGHA